MSLRSLPLFVAVVASFVFASGQAFALNRIDFAPVGASAGVGEFVDVEITMTFDETTFGGGVAIDYDQSVLSFDSFVFDPTFTANFGLSEPSAGSLENPLEIQFGWFFVASPLVESTIGTLRFLATAPGAATIDAGPIAASPFAGSIGDLVVEFGSTGLTVVPEPGTGLLMMLGLAGLSARRTRSA